MRSVVMLGRSEQYRRLADGDDIDYRSESKETMPSAPRKSSHLTQQIKQRLANNLTVEVPVDNTLQPIFMSFDQYDQAELPKWIKHADVRGDIDTWARNNPSAWVLEPNATTDEQMLSVINSHAIHHPVKKSFGLALATVLTAGIYPALKSRKIRQGEIHFSENAGRQEISIEPGIATLVSPTHVWKKKEDIQSDYIKVDNITIARIPEGHIGLARYQGATVILLPGRHAYNSGSFRFHPHDIEKFNEPVIEFSTISIIRILPNQLGLAFKQGNPILLLPGLHVQNSGSFEYKAKIDSRNFCLLDSEQKRVDDLQHACFEHDSITLVRVNRDQYGCAIQNGNPVFLLPGIHIIKSCDFKFVEIKNSNTSHLQFHSIHVISVREGQVGLAWEDNKPVILGPGIYNKNSSTFKFERMENKNTKCIKHGSITLLWVDEGEFAYALYQGKTIEHSPGEYRSDDPQFKYIKHASKMDKVIQVGMFTRIKIDKGEVGYIWENGEKAGELLPRTEPYVFDGPRVTYEKQAIKINEPLLSDTNNMTQIVVNEGEVRAIWKESKLEMLATGIHAVDLSKDKLSESAISIQDQILALEDVSLTAPGKTPMSVTGQIVYRISDPRLLISHVGSDRINDKLASVAKMAFKKQLSLSDIQKNYDRPEERTDRNHCDHIQEILKKEVSKWGIEILSVNVIDLHFQNREVEHTLAKVDADILLQKSLNDLVIEKEKTKAVSNNIKTQAGRLFTPGSSTTMSQADNVPLSTTKAPPAKTPFYNS